MRRSEHEITAGRMQYRAGTGVQVATTQEDRTYPPVGVYRTGNDPLGRVGDRLLARAVHRCMNG